MRKLIVEISDKGGVRLERVALADQSLTIGRAWDSDVILQDHFVDSEHFELYQDEQGRILLDDLKSTNGTKVAGKTVQSQERVYRLGDSIKVGDTTVRFFDSAGTVPPTSLRSSWFLMADRFSDWLSLLVLTMVALSSSLALNYFFSPKPINADKATVTVLSYVMLLLLWSLLLGFIGKLVRGESNFKALWVLGCLGLLATSLITVILRILRFNLQSYDLSQGISVVTFSVFVIWLIVGVLSYITHLESKTKWLASFFVIIVIYGFGKSEEYLKEDHQKWQSSTRSEHTTLPPGMLFRAPVSIEEYQNSTDKLFEFELE